MKKIIFIMAIFVVVSLIMTSILMFQNFDLKKQVNSSDLLSHKINAIVEDSYNSYGKHKDTKYDNYISDKLYSYLCFRVKKPDIKNEYFSGKVTQLEYDGDNAKAIYEYTYTAYDKDNAIITSCGVPEPIHVTIKLKYGEIDKNGDEISCWRITEVFEHP
jgi:hypothetical protein